MVNIDDIWLKADGSLRVDTELAPEDHPEHRGWGELTKLAKDNELNIKIPRGSVIENLESIDGRTPLELTTTMEDRDRLVALYSHPKVRMDQQAAGAVLKALQDSEKIAPPILPPSDYSLMAYVDEFGKLKCKETHRFALMHHGKMSPYVLTQGREYTVELRAEGYLEPFERSKVHFNPESKKMTKVKHDCRLDGKDTILYLSIHTIWSPNTDYVRGELVQCGNSYKWYRCDADHTSGEQMDKDVFVMTYQCDREIIFRQHVTKDKRRGPPEVDESILWDIFEKPPVQTITEKYPEKYQHNRDVIQFMETFGDFKWFPAQLEYISAMACADTGLVAAETGAGKSAMAIALIQAKGPKRTLLIAPKGTVKDDSSTLDVAQWAAEFEKFAPDTPVHKIFSEEDYYTLVKENYGEAPYGVYISYDYIMFRQGALESRPGAWTTGTQESKMRRFCGLPKYQVGDSKYAQNIGVISDGREVTYSEPNLDFVNFDGEQPTGVTDNAPPPKPYHMIKTRVEGGFKCVAKPCLAQKIGTIWDMIVVDEAHVMKNPDAQITKALTMVQAPYRFCLTATPIPNFAYDIFMLMGWLAVPHFWRGNRSNPRWPYTRQQIGKFKDRFLSKEIDLTQREINKKTGRAVSTTKESPILSEPTPLLKLCAPILGFITKAQCNPNVVKCNIHDVRVQLSLEQHTMYEHWLDMENIPVAGNQLVAVQLQYLRGVCASPTDGKHAENYDEAFLPSPFNNKIIAVLESALSCLLKGEQVVIVYSHLGQAAELHRRLTQAGITTSRIDSTTRSHSMEANYFKAKKTQVLLMGIKCAQAYSFSQCTNLIIASLDWSYGKFNQALGRVYRLNSHKDVSIYCILIQDSVEEMIYDKLVTKEDAATIVLHGKRVPRSTKTMEPGELLAEHLFDWKEQSGLTSEYELETKYWPEIKAKLKESTQLEEIIL